MNNNDEQNKSLIMSAVVAMATNRVIGDGIGLIWHLPGDLKRVKALTMGCPLIMGRKTWESIGRPLPGRGSIVLTRSLQWEAEGAFVVNSFSSAILAAKTWIARNNPKCQKIILFGGGEIYRIGLDFCHQIDLTVVHITPDEGANATLFPKLNKQDWKRERESNIKPDVDTPAYTYERWTRLNPPMHL